jgi:acyl carrier protein
MNNEVFNKLKSFLLGSGWGITLPLFEEKEIGINTRIKEDLKINGDDADKFLIAFGNEFKVDVSQFKIDEYFDDEGEPILRAIIRMVTGKQRRQTKELTITHLEKAVLAGRLDEEVINS